MKACEELGIKFVDELRANRPAVRECLVLMGNVSKGTRDEINRRAFLADAVEKIIELDLKLEALEKEWAKG